MKKILLLLFIFITLKSTACSELSNLQVINSYTNSFDISFENLSLSFFQVSVINTETFNEEYFAIESPQELVDGQYSFTDASFSPNTEYLIKLRRYCSSSDQSDWIEITATTLNDCETPVNVTFSDLTTTSGVANLNSDISFVGYRYEIVYAETNTSLETFIFDTTTESTFSFPSVFSTLEAGIEYKMRIKIECTNDVYSDWSEYFFFTTLEASCETPEVNIDNITQEGFDISAVLPTNGVQYKVEIREINNGIVSDQIVQLYQYASGFTVDILEPDTSYQIRIKTICSETNSSDWITQNIVTEASCATPTNITFSEITYNSAVATIEDVENALTYEYFLYKKETNEQISNVNTNNGGLILNLPVSGDLEPETTYQLKVRRKCADNTWSEFTELYEFTTTEFVCLMPTDIEITNVTTESFYVNLNIESGNSFQYNLYKGEEEIRTNDINATPSGYFPVTDLETNTTYKIKIKRLCELNGESSSSEFTELFEVTTLDDLNISELEIEGLKIYPNPVNDILNFTSKEKIQSMKIKNILGKVIFEEKLNKTNGTINVSGLNDGIYFLLIKSGNKINTVKILKN
ncbi:T9SS type A sorting domain-containing protein [Aureivirga sp. CE67]|uniref:T9SS type A sorting domain-containing protein n=1 Tax=Aureivirga sp. CE67 TaxID=1788983 RepID=UPI0018CA037D|nr:T9SS type A sorting domain-containing protein [Aureivirga sp. CE67]